MIVLDTTLKSLEANLSANITSNQLVFTAVWGDLDQSSWAVTAFSEGDGLTNNVTVVTLVAAPASGQSRQVRFLSLFNADTVNATATIYLNNNGTRRQIVSTTLSPKDTLMYRDDGFSVIDANGEFKTQGYALQANNALFLNGQPDTFYTNATNIITGTLDSARLVIANTTANGIVSTIAQSFAGDKTFTGAAIINGLFTANASANVNGTLLVVNSVAQSKFSGTDFNQLILESTNTGGVSALAFQTLDANAVSHQGTQFFATGTGQDANNIALFQLFVASSQKFRISSNTAVGVLLSVQSGQNFVGNSSGWFFTNNVAVSGISSLTGNVTTGGFINVGTTLQVAGTSILNGTLTANAGLTVNGAAIFNSTISANGGVGSATQVLTSGGASANAYWSPAGGLGGNGYGTFAVSGQANLVAQAVNAIATFVAGNGIVLTTNVASDGALHITGIVANSSVQGDLSTGAQTLAGDKTFTGNTVANNLSFTGNVTSNVVIANLISGTTNTSVSLLTLTPNTIVNGLLTANAGLTVNGIVTVNGSALTTSTFYKLDTIASSFNSSQTVFNLKVSTVAITPGTAENLLLVIDGVIQEPETAFTLSGSTITFTAAPVTGSTFFGIVLGSLITSTANTSLGNTTINGTLTANGAVSANGLVTLIAGQIKFPTTQNTSSDVNTLDDYEEGTWTPILVGSSGTTTYTTQAGTYTKIGNRVCFNAYCVATGAGTLAGNMAISGLPFTSKSGSQEYGCSVGYFSGLNANIIWIGGYIDPGFTKMLLTKLTAAGVNAQAMTASDIAATAFIIGGSYDTA